ncbi:hypothetical protein [Spirillospora sp. CA-294931]|uniref:hypothetical protein n=1 Tax=Spirillospora sp. CA-294931 TaxID=3240042 RepID=UPI003D8D54AA
MRTRLVGVLRPGPCRAALTGALLGALLTACGDSGSTSGGDFKPNGSPTTAQASPTTPTSTAPSALPTEQVNQTVLQRYLEYQKVYKRAYEQNDPTELATVAVNPLLGQVSKDVERTKAKGQIWRFTNVSNPKVYARAKDGATVYVIDCMRTLSGYRFSATTGKRTAGGTGDAFVYRTALRYDAGLWKVSDSVRDKKC